jgi:endonuclease/exonuclease/phosphatase family metal-dependent hydrolase
MISSPYRRRAIAASLCATVLAALTLAIVPEVVQADPVPRPVKVMTRNLYLGADLTPALAATTPEQLAIATTVIWENVMATNFPERAQLLAYEIADADPDLIGLQEAAIWQTQFPADGPPILGGTPAETPFYDYLQLLLDELEAIGTPYVVVSSQEEADIESTTLGGFDIRLTQQDVILAKASKIDAGELDCTKDQGAQYPSAIQLQLPLLGGLVFVESTRGYVWADCVVNERAFRFVNTHLEAFSAGRRAQQAGFLAQFGPASTTSQPVVLVGDLNSDPNDGSSTPPDPTPNNLAINLLMGTFGYVDTWTQVNPGSPGFTSGFNEFVDDPDASGLSKRIDHVMTRPQVTVRTSRVTGTDPDNRSIDGLWPSDHAGLITTVAP